MDEKRTAIPFRLELICVLLLLSLIVLVRARHLDADPPIGLSISSDVYTDPPQYTLFAKQFVKTGDFNPFHDYRFALFLKSTVTVLAVVVFKLFGAGIVQSNLVGLLFAVGSLFLFYLFIRRVGGQIAGLLYLALICFNYNQLFYGRLPFLEHAMTFFAFLSLVLVTHARRWIGFALGGMSLAVSIFFGKVLGVVFAFPFACYFAYRARYEDDPPRPGLLGKLTNPGYFAAGFVVVTVFWFFFTYLPLKDQVAGYLGEKSVSLYGAPEGLQSLYSFVEKMVTLGDTTKLFPRMATVALLGLVLIFMLFYHVSRRRSWREGFGALNAGHVFMVTMIAAFYGSLMIWNYRPLRYLVVMIYPFYGAAAVVLSMLWRKWRTHAPENTPPLFYVLAFPAVMAAVFQLCSNLAESFGKDFYFDAKKYQTAACAVAVTLLTGVIISLYRRGKLPRVPLAAKALVVLIVLGVVSRGLADYLYWLDRPTFMARDNSRDLGMILSPQAVLSGPYAPQLTLESDLGTVIHMFGVSEADPDLFRKFPVTHLLVDEGNESRARADYPDLMDSAVHVCTYYNGLKKTRVFRIAGLTGNPQAGGYSRSSLEWALDYFNADQGSQGNQSARQFMKDHPDNIAGNLMMGEKAFQAELFDEAEWFFKKAVEFSPTNYDLNARLAQFYRDVYAKTQNPQHKARALEYFELSLKYAPTVEKIRQSYEELKGE
jgi:hypothetical protein